MSEPLEFRVLGPLEVSRSGRTIELPAGKPHALLAVLLLHRNRVVSVDALVEELWAGRPPRTAAIGRPAATTAHVAVLERV